MQIKFNEVTWYSKLGAVILFILIVPVLAFIIGREYQKTLDVLENGSRTQVNGMALSKPVNHLTFNIPKNGTYDIDGQLLTFTNGVNQQEVAPGSALKIVTSIFGPEEAGDINEDGLHDSVFFVSQETGGTGVFYYVVAAVQKDGAYVGTQAIFLGDRISPKNINIVDGIAQVNYADRRPGEPMAAVPSVGVTKYIRADGSKLLELVR